MSSPWLTYGTVALHTLIIYLYLIVLVRIFSRRQLGQLTVIDLIVVILLGSAVETAMINGNTAIRAGLISAATLMLANFALSQVFLRIKRFRHLVGSGPVLIVHNGHYVDENLKRIGLTHDDVLEALRSRECAELADVRFAVMEVDGTVNVILSGK
ncbi:MAG TPA: YetF domain-containing protein [Fimbriimonadaceae bacterium]|jgi:uncharacterized membrane protein YcaP (DUF421 family)